MTVERRLEGSCAPLFFAAITLLAIAANSVLAQTVDRSELELCASLETPELKLACFEVIIAISAPSEGQRPEAAADPANPGSAVPEVEVAPEEVITQVARSPAPGTQPAVALQILIAAPSAVAPQTATDAQRAVTAPPNAAAVVRDESAASGFGQEHLDQSETKENEIIKAVVFEVTKGRHKVLYFHLTNGHIWRQIEGRYFPYPKTREFNVEITRGGLGEYRMRIEGGGRMVRIRRVK